MSERVNRSCVLQRNERGAERVEADDEPFVEWARYAVQSGL